MFALFNKKSSQQEPKVSIHSIFTVAQAAGVVDFSEMLEKAFNAGQINEQEAAKLLAKAKSDENSARSGLKQAIAKANALFDQKMTGVIADRTKAHQQAAIATEISDAINEIKAAMGK